VERREWRAAEEVFATWVRKWVLSKTNVLCKNVRNDRLRLALSQMLTFDESRWGIYKCPWYHYFIFFVYLRSFSIKNWNIHTFGIEHVHNSIKEHTCFLITMGKLLKKDAIFWIWAALRPFKWNTDNSWFCYSSSLPKDKDNHCDLSDTMQLRNFVRRLLLSKMEKSY
jgi:hypothetical protein